MHTNVVRIFISSPADVGYERARAERVAERLSGLIDGLTVETYRWEKDRYFSAHDSFQPQILSVDTFDIVVGLFWSRVGSALPPSFPNMPDGRPYPSGTAYEVLRAIEHRRENDAPLPDVLVYRKTAPIPISVEKEEERSQQSAALNTLDAFMDEYFVNPQEGFKAAFQSFRDADEFERLFEMHLRAWLRDNRRLGRERVWRVEEKGSPFRGLKPFEFEHRDAFFGRKADVERARERLHDAAVSGCAFLLIEGASGTGKSSMARAGLLPRLKDLDPDLRLAIVTAGVNPIETLSTALFSSYALPELADGDFDTPQVFTQHLAGGGGITPILRALERSAAAMVERDDRKTVPSLRLVLLIDQLEGVFTGSVETLARQRFCETLLSLARSGQVLVIATLRADGRASALAEPSLASLIDQGAGLALAPPGPEALAEIVRGPAQAAGLVFARRPEDGLGLDEILIQDAGGTDALPLLQFVLEGLYEAAIARIRASGRALGDVEPDEPVAILDIADYRGLADAVEAKAEETFGKLPATSQAALPRLVRALTEPGPGGTAVLRTATLEEAAPDREAEVLVSTMVDARILVRENTLLRFSHETALRGWGKAAAAAAEAETFLRVRADVARQQARWLEGGRHRSLLIPQGMRLAEAEAMQKAHGEELAPFADYIGRSRRRAEFFHLVSIAAAILFLILALTATYFAYNSEIQRLAAKEQEYIATKNQGFALAALSEVELQAGRPKDAAWLALLAVPQLSQSNKLDDEELLEVSLSSLSNAIIALPQIQKVPLLDEYSELHLSPNRESLATASGAVLMIIPDISNPRQRIQVVDNEDEIETFGYSHDSEKIVIIRRNRIAEMVEVSSGDILGRMSIGRITKSDSPLKKVITNGKWIALLSVNNRLSIYQFPNPHNESVSDFNESSLPENVFDAAFSLDGKNLAILGSEDRGGTEILILDVAETSTSQPVVDSTAVGGLPVGGIFKLRYSDSGQHIVIWHTASLGFNEDVRVWTPSEQTVNLIVNQSLFTETAHFSPDGRDVAVSFEDNERFVGIYRLSGLQVLSVSFPEDAKKFLGFSQSGSALLFESQDGGFSSVILKHYNIDLSDNFNSFRDDLHRNNVQAIEVPRRLTAGQREKREIEVDDQMESTLTDAGLWFESTSPEGRFAYFYDHGRTSIFVYQVYSGKLVLERRLRDIHERFVFSDEKSLLATFSCTTGRTSGTHNQWRCLVEIIDLSSGSILNRLLIEDDIVKSLAFSKTGSGLAIGLSEGAIRRFDYLSGIVSDLSTGLYGEIISIDYSQDDKLLGAVVRVHEPSGKHFVLLSVSEDIILMELEFSFEPGPIAISPDGMRLAVEEQEEFGEGGNLHVIDVHTSKPVFALRNIWLATDKPFRLGGIDWLRFSSDGATIYAGATMGLHPGRRPWRSQIMRIRPDLPEGSIIDIACTWLESLDQPALLNRYGFQVADTSC